MGVTITPGAMDIYDELPESRDFDILKDLHTCLSYSKGPVIQGNKLIPSSIPAFPSKSRCQERTSANLHPIFC